MKTVTVYGLPAKIEDSRVPLLKLLESQISEVAFEIDRGEMIGSVNLPAIHNQNYFSPEVVIYADGFISVHTTPERLSELKRNVKEKFNEVVQGWLTTVRQNSGVRVDDVKAVKIIVS